MEGESRTVKKLLLKVKARDELILNVTKSRIGRFYRSRDGQGCDAIRGPVQTAPRYKYPASRAAVRLLGISDRLPTAGQAPATNKKAVSRLCSD